MNEPALLLRDARRRAGLTQRQLSLRLGVSQAAVAKLERPGANPTFATLAGALWSTGHHLELAARPRHDGIDESLVRQQLELSPTERLRNLEAMYTQARTLALTGARSRGERV
ncbi:MAG TPA: helix-turn-helix domain-containing protein [Solirubrobacteraceae bacterium]|jgi:DNA-binding XRE family transcriptional regulator